MCTTPPMCSMFRYTYAWAAVSLEGCSVSGVPSSILTPSRVHTTIASADRSSYETPDGLITKSSWPIRSAQRMRWLTLPAVQTTSSHRGSSAWSVATTSRVRATSS